jgi:hypothetical protein
MSDEFKTPKDVLPQVFEDIERMYGTEGVPPITGVWVDWRSRMIRFDPVDYEINLSLIRDEGEILYWVEHLSEKNWITVKLLTEFVRAATVALIWSRARKMA